MLHFHFNSSLPLSPSLAFILPHLTNNNLLRTMELFVSAICSGEHLLQQAAQIAAPRAGIQDTPREKIISQTKRNWRTIFPRSSRYEESRGAPLLGEVMCGLWEIDSSAWIKSNRHPVCQSYPCKWHMKAAAKGKNPQSLSAISTEGNKTCWLTWRTCRGRS